MAILLARANEVATVLLAFYVQLETPANCLRQSVLIPSYVEALRLAQSSVDDIEDLMKDADGTYAAPDFVEWGMTLSDITEWVAAASTCLIDIRGRLYRQCSVEMVATAAIVKKDTPLYAHFCNDKTFVVPLVRRHLLAVQSKFENQAVRLFRCISQLCHMSQELSQPNPKTDPSHMHALEAANGVYTAAKKAVTVIVACDCVLNMKGEAQVQEAKKLLEKRADLMPGALVAKLKGVANTEFAQVKVAAKACTKEGTED